MRTIAVIGAAFGDEGKGRTVDDLLIDADPDRALVVRHNSSAQAGHTVDHGDCRHVFSHFGSGTLRGVPTHLGWDFVVNPRIFAEELDDLIKLGLDPVMTCSPGSLITTPYDTAANQIMEVARGAHRHGSCGVGFGQTIRRSLIQQGLNLRAGFWPGETRLLLREVREFYLRNLPQIAGVDHPAAEFMRNDNSDLSPWIDALARFKDRVKIRPASRMNRNTVIFEGAQGLMLDQDHPTFFPHVTRCSTGLRDVVSVALSMGRRNIEAMYVIRPYLTRHGAGPLPNERREAPPAPGFEDLTNQPNDWQGSLRFGLLNPEHVIAEIDRDLLSARRAGVLIQPALTMTCLDQVGPTGTMPIARGGLVELASPVAVAKEIATAIGAHQVDFTYGPRPGHRSSVLLGDATRGKEAYA